MEPRDDLAAAEAVIADHERRIAALELELMLARQHQALTSYRGPERRQQNRKH